MEPQENKIEEVKNNEREKDIFLQDYLLWKKHFIKISSILGVKFNKKDTSKFVKILKPHKNSYKNLNPIKHSKDSNDNIYLTKFLPEEKGKLEEVLKNEKNWSIIEESITLNEKNFSYEEIFKYFIEDEIDKKKLDENEINVDNLLKTLPNGFEIVGKIAHMNLRDQYLKYKYFIGQLILDKNPSLSTVINKVGKIDNVYRTYDMEILAGEENYNVEHKEGNVRFQFDLRKTYWCSRLQNERDRVLKLLKKNEVLCDAFCGVGPLALRACKQGVKGINKLNKDNIKTYNMDAREFIKGLVNMSKNNVDEDEENGDKIFPKDLHINHFYMNLPKDAIEFMDIFVGLFKGCKNDIYNKDNLPIIHVYGFAKIDNNPHELLKKRIARAFKIEYDLFKKECEKDILNIQNVRDISNKKVVYCIDMKIPEIIAYQKYTLYEYKEDEDNKEEKEEEEEEDEEEDEK